MRRAVVVAVRRSPTTYHAAKTVQACARAARRTLWIAARRGAIRRYVNAHDVKKLQLGAGQFPTPGWLNTDLDPTQARASSPSVIFVDATRRLPFADATFHYVYLEHTIEHLPLTAGRGTLTECARVLRHGGRIRIATPDLARLVGLYEHRNDPSPDENAYVRWVAAKLLPDSDRATVPSVLNNAFSAWGHKFLFDEETLRTALAEVGFTNIRRWDVGESDDAHLRGLETHGRAVGSEAMNAFETMVLEAERPAP